MADPGGGRRPLRGALDLAFKSLRRSGVRHRAARLLPDGSALPRRRFDPDSRVDRARGSRVLAIHLGPPARRSRSRVPPRLEPPGAVADPDGGEVHVSSFTADLHPPWRALRAPDRTITSEHHRGRSSRRPADEEACGSRRRDARSAPTRSADARPGGRLRR